MPESSSGARGDATREMLVASATEAFARVGYHAASTRAIAEAAGVNQALIGYHFRNKDGLYLAVFEHIAENISGHVGPVVDAIESRLAQNNDHDLDERRDAYLPLLRQLADAMLALMAREETASWAQLIVREQLAPTSAFNILYDGFMGRMLKLLTRMVERLDSRGSLGDPRMVVLGILGQVLVYRTARAGVLRHMQWAAISEAELRKMQAHVAHAIVLPFTTLESDNA